MDRLAHILSRKGIDKVTEIINSKGLGVPMYKDINKDKIINLICDYYKVDVLDVVNSNTRLKEVIIAKYMSMYFISKDYPELRDTDISKIFNVHRTTLLYAKKKISELLEFDKYIIEDFNELRGRITNLYI